MLTIFSVLLSIGTIITMWLAGNGDKRAWFLGLANQGLWIILIISTEAWGLFLLTAALIFVYTRNLLKWRRIRQIWAEEERAEETWNYDDDGNLA